MSEFKEILIDIKITLLYSNKTHILKTKKVRLNALVAQPVERSHGKAEVCGSNPHGG